MPEFFQQATLFINSTIVYWIRIDLILYCYTVEEYWLLLKTRSLYFDDVLIQVNKLNI